MVKDALLQDLAQCGSAETLVAAILRHHPEWLAPIDVKAFAQSIGITSFNDIAADGVTSGLTTSADRRSGTILHAKSLSAPRERLAIAHQLGHFLIRDHTGDHQCRTRDLFENRRDTPQRKQEMQANRFAAGLLMPKPLFVAYLESLGKPGVAHLQTIAATYGVPLETAAARYVELARGVFAILLIKDGVVRYALPGRAFPALSLRPGDPAPPGAAPGDKIAWAPADPREWVILSRETRPPGIAIQRLSKDNGLQIVMLSINAAAERRADEEAEKAATEGPKFGRRMER